MTNLINSMPETIRAVCRDIFCAVSVPLTEVPYDVHMCATSKCAIRVLLTKVLNMCDSNGGAFCVPQQGGVDVKSTSCVTDIPPPVTPRVHNVGRNPM